LVFMRQGLCLISTLHGNLYCILTFFHLIDEKLVHKTKIDLD